MNTHTQFLATHTNTEDGVQSFVTLNTKGYYIGLIDLESGDVLPMGKTYSRDKFTFDAVNKKALEAVI